MRFLLPLALAALIVAAGCSKDKDVEPPAVLVDFPQTLPVKEIWHEGVGGGKKQMVLRLGLGPAIDQKTCLPPRTRAKWSRSPWTRVATCGKRI